MGVSGNRMTKWAALARTVAVEALSPSCATGSKGTQPIIFRDAASVTEDDERPLMTVKVPEVVHGDRLSNDMNPCFPGDASAPWRGAGNPGTTALKQTALGEIERREFKKRIREDICEVEGSCFGATSKSALMIKRNDATWARVYRGISRSNDNTVTVAYYIDEGQLVRLSFWSSSAIAEAVVEEIFKMYVSGSLPRDESASR